MNEQRLRDLLLSAPVPDEVEALRRNWRVVRTAYEREEPPSVRARYARPVIALAAALALLAGALSPPGQAVGGWLRDEVRERVAGRTPASPALVSLPAPGRLLVVSDEGAWVVHADGSKRRVGAYQDASWSPHGLFVAAVRGRQLVAVEPGGDPRWSLARSGRIRHARWSPSGFRIAYLSGRSLRVVAGDGSPDRLLARAVAPVAPAWRPGETHVLAYVTRTGVVQVADTDSRKLLWTWDEAEEAPEELAWSADGKRLAARAPHALYIFDRRGRLLASLPPTPPVASRSVAVAFAPKGHALAVIAQGRGRSEVVLVQAERGRAKARRLFAGAGRFGGVAWSPDGRWLLVTWPSADQWLFLPTPHVRKVVAVSNISRQFDPGRAGRPEFPEVTGWCCQP